MKTATITINGKRIGFIAKESTDDECVGCMFDRHGSRMCRAAESSAAQADQPDCEDKAPNNGTYIYVEADPRQLPLIDGGEQ